MKLFIAYAKEPPCLPIAVAGSAAELARMLGIKENCIQTGISHGAKTYARVEVENEQI